MPTHFINGDVLSNEWALVLGVGTAFFLVQIALTVAFCFRVRRQERALEQLFLDFELGGSGRLDVQSLPRKSSWTPWVVSHFPTDAMHSSNFTREDALEELDTRLASDGSYLLLQRMGVMAPLIGVVLTVTGFYWIRVGEENESLQSILWAVTPLVSGIGTGAVLALINQALLHIASRRVESLRMTARTWFDAVIWDSIGCGKQANPANAVQVTEQFVSSALEDIDRLTDTLARAAEISVAISALPEQIRNILDRKLPIEQDAASTDSSGRVVTHIPRAAK